MARKRQRMNNGDAMDMDENGEVGIRTRSKSRNRSQSHIRGPTRDKSGMRPAEADKVFISEFNLTILTDTVNRAQSH